MHRPDRAATGTASVSGNPHRRAPSPRSAVATPGIHGNVASRAASMSAGVAPGLIIATAPAWAAARMSPTLRTVPIATSIATFASRIAWSAGSAAGVRSVISISVRPASREHARERNGVVDASSAITGNAAARRSRISNMANPLATRATRYRAAPADTVVLCRVTVEMSNRRFLVGTYPRSARRAAFICVRWMRRGESTSSTFAKSADPSFVVAASAAAARVRGQ